MEMTGVRGLYCISSISGTKISKSSVSSYLRSTDWGRIAYRVQTKPMLSSKNVADRMTFRRMISNEHYCDGTPRSRMLLDHVRRPSRLAHRIRRAGPARPDQRPVGIGTSLTPGAADRPRNRSGRDGDAHQARRARRAGPPPAKSPGRRRYPTAPNRGRGGGEQGPDRARGWRLAHSDRRRALAAAGQVPPRAAERRSGAAGPGPATSSA